MDKLVFVIKSVKINFSKANADDGAISELIISRRHLGTMCQWLLNTFRRLVWIVPMVMVIVITNRSYFVRLTALARHSLPVKNVRPIAVCVGVCAIAAVLSSTCTATAKKFIQSLCRCLKEEVEKVGDHCGDGKVHCVVFNLVI